MFVIIMELGGVLNFAIKDINLLEVFTQYVPIKVFSESYDKYMMRNCSNMHLLSWSENQDGCRLHTYPPGY